MVGGGATAVTTTGAAGAGVMCVTAAGGDAIEYPALGYEG